MMLLQPFKTHVTRETRIRPPSGALVHTASLRPLETVEW